MNMFFINYCLNFHNFLKVNFCFTFCQRWPEAELEIIHDSGHSAKEVGIVSALVNAADKYKSL